MKDAKVFRWFGDEVFMLWVRIVQAIPSRFRDSA